MNTKPPAHWNGRRYYSLDSFLKQAFHEKLYKLSLDGGMTCPNRDGTISTGGCIFCSGGGSGDFAADRMLPIEQQLEQAKKLVRNKFDGSRYIAYFQAFTNTYALAEKLRKLFEPVIRRKDIAVLSLATRPDCLEEDKLQLLQELSAIKPVWVELGLQTIHTRTAELINRGYALACFDEAVQKLKSIGINVIVHIIVGLPGENHENILSTARYVAHSKADGIKIQLLHVLQNTRLCDMYRAGKFDTLAMEEYVNIVCDILAELPPDMVVHRLTGDGNRQLLEAPLWSGHKQRVLNAIHHQMKIRNLLQGMNFTDF